MGRVSREKSKRRTKKVGGGKKDIREKWNYKKKGAWKSIILMGIAEDRGAGPYERWSWSARGGENEIVWDRGRRLSLGGLWIRPLAVKQARGYMKKRRKKRTGQPKKQTSSCPEKLRKVQVAGGNAPSEQNRSEVAGK